MRLIKKSHEVILNDSNPVVIYLFADTHIGNPGFNEKLLRKHIQMCKEEDAYWIHLGDWCEAISPKDRRFDVRGNTGTIISQYMRAIEIFGPIKDKCLAILTGNHDEKIATTHGDHVGMIAQVLGLPYLGYMGFINLGVWHNNVSRSPNYNYIILAHHGGGYGTTIGASANNLQKMSGKFEANLYMVGHTHKYLSHEDTKIMVKGRGMIHKPRHYIQCPSYFNSYRESDPNYVHKKAYQPNPVGCIRVEIYRRDGRLIPSIMPMLEGK